VSPNLIHKFTNGPNLEVAQRGIGEAEVYGFKFAQLVLPRLEHRNERMRKISGRYASETPLINENTTSTLGAAGALGLLAVFGIIFSTLAGRTQNRTLIIASLIVFVLLMFGTIGGIGSIFAQIITTSIRGWNRISVFISFGVLLVLFMLLQAEIQKHFSGQRFVFLSSLIAIIFLLGGLYDQTIPTCPTCNEQTKKAFNMDREFVRSIENSLPVGSAVYQLPYMPFPEVPPLHRLQSYDLSVGFLHSSALHWNYGGMKGRSGDLFYRSLAKEPLKRQLEVIKQLGFAGVYIDRRGFDDNDRTVMDGWSNLLGVSPTLTRADGDVVFFRLNQDGPYVNLEGLSDDQLMIKAGYIVDHLGVRYISTLAEGIDFARPDFPNFVKDVSGLSVSEPWGRWSDANLASSVRFDFKESLPNRFSLIFLAQSFGPNSGQDLEVRIGTQRHHFNMKDSLFEYRQLIDLGSEKVTRIEFVPPKPTSPQQLKLSSDSRKLGIGLVRLRFEEKNATEPHSLNAK
jgi:phosphoglycerol transferase